MSTLKDSLERLQSLQVNIANTRQLLGIDAMNTEIEILEKRMQDPGFWTDSGDSVEVSKKRESLASDVREWDALRDEVNELIALVQDLQENSDEGLEAELATKVVEIEKNFAKREFFVLMDGKYDMKHALVAIHAGSGGTEAQDWSEMLMRMIMRYVEKKGWSVTILDESRGAEAGIKSVMFRVEGRYAFGHLKSEHGTHRLVRISPFDAEHMRHTSFALVEVIPEVDAHDAVSIDHKDLRIDTFMSGGKGGQSVNTTYSAVRIVHIPTGITVQCQNERSQAQNKDTAMKILLSRLITLQEERDEQERLKLRGDFKSPEWGSQIRSYVLHPYKMVKDVRTRYETADTDAVLNGELDPFVEAYLKFLKSDKS